MALSNCPDCGHEVSSEAPSCPNCGKPWPGRQPAPPMYQSQPRPPKNNGFAVASLVMGILSLLCLQPFGIVAVILGPMAISQLNSQQREGLPEDKGRGMAIAGTVMGIIALVLTAVGVMYLVAVTAEGT